MFVLIARYSDGCTYQSDNALAVFTDESVAELVAESLTAIATKQKDSSRDFPDLRHGGFSVQPITAYAAESESRVQGIVDALLREHFPRS